MLDSTGVQLISFLKSLGSSACLEEGWEGKLVGCGTLCHHAAVEGDGFAWNIVIKGASDQGIPQEVMGVRHLVEHFDRRVEAGEFGIGIISHQGAGQVVVFGKSLFDEKSVGLLEEREGAVTLGVEELSKGGSIGILR